jgi:hypothetical protein
MKKNNHLRKIKKDYQCKNLKNPFFRKNKKESRSGLAKCLLIAAGLLFVFLIWLILAAPFWRIKNIKIEGLTRFDCSEVEKIINEQSAKHRLLFFKQNNICLFNKEEAAAKIQADFNLAAVEIKKKLASTIIVKISERPYAFIYQEGSATYFSSADNYLIKEISLEDETKNNGEELKRYFILENKNPTSLISTDKKLLLKEDYLKFVTNLKSELDRHPELPLERFIISDEYFNSIFVKIKDGPYIFINVKDDIAAQIKRLLLVKNEKIKDNFNKLDYIDLRYGDKIFFSPENLVK